MICPKCKKEIPDDESVCSNCGTVLRKNTENEKKSRFSFFGLKKDKNIAQTQNPEKSKKFVHVLKIVLAVMAAVLVIVVIVLIVASVTGSKGEKNAQKISAYIGENLTDAENKLDIHFKDESAYRGLNKAVKFDYCIESQKNTKVDGVKYPQWAVLLTVDGKDRISTVKYIDFTVLKDNINGSRKDGVINIDKFKKGEKWNNVNDEIDADCFETIYSGNTVNYTYRYYYTADNGDTQPMILDATFDKQGKYIYYTSSAVYPSNF